jgi:hypothetical protein
MSDLQHLFQRQAAWQKKRESLSWPDKIRMVEAMQGTLRQLRNSGDRLPNSRIPDSPKPDDPGIA